MFNSECCSSLSAALECDASRAFVGTCFGQQPSSALSSTPKQDLRFRWQRALFYFAFCAAAVVVPPDQKRSAADKLMDAWMADPTLNANGRVARWHESAQRCGFKFLVTQLMGYLTGGPQVYTGRDMASSHKHLNISEEEWALDSLFFDGNAHF